MQDNSQILYKAISKIIDKKRKEKGIKYTDFCYENDIPTSTYDDIINAKTQATFFNISKIIKGLNLSFKDFGELLDKELPQNFLSDD